MLGRWTSPPEQSYIAGRTCLCVVVYCRAIRIQQAPFFFLMWCDVTYYRSHLFVREYLDPLRKKNVWLFFFSLSLSPSLVLLSGYRMYAPPLLLPSRR